MRVRYQFLLGGNSMAQRAMRYSSLVAAHMSGMTAVRCHRRTPICQDFYALLTIEMWH